MSKPLSPAAQTVLDAFTEDNSLHDWKHNHFNVQALAVALRAAAEQVAPREPMKDPLWASDAYRQRADIRAHLLAIAAELEGGTSTSSTHLEIGDE